MYMGLLHAHAGLRWLVFIFLIIAASKSLIGWLNKKEYNKSDNIIALLLLSFTHIQMILGVVLYFNSPSVKPLSEAMKNAITRFWSLEHGFLMFMAIVLITLGRVTSKKANDKLLKQKKGAIFYIIALLIILWGGVIKPYLIKGTLF